MKYFSRQDRRSEVFVFQALQGVHMKSLRNILGLTFRFRDAVFVNMAVVFLFVLLAGQARGALILDPYIGYAGGSASGTYVADGSTFAGAYAGSAYGARLAWSFPVIFLGFDYGVTALNYTAADANSTNSTTTFTTTYAILGAHFSDTQ